MKLRNKKTGEIFELNEFCLYDGKGFAKRPFLNSLAELNEEWEDYEEPKGNWTIDPMNEDYIDDGRYTAPDELERYEELGLKFETKEEAEKAVEKLKAWKRLKGHNLRVERGQRIFVNANNKLTSQKPLFVVDTYEEVEDDLDLLFGGEE